MASNTHSLDLESGSSQTAAGADSAALSLTGDLSIACWIYRESAGSAMALFTKWTEAGNVKSYQLRIASTDFLQFRISSDGSSDSTVTDTASAVNSTSGWYHVAAVYDASAGSCEFFVNGTSVSTKTGLVTSIHDNNSVPRIGSRGDGVGNPSEFYDGLIDEVCIFSRVLTGDEVADLYGGQAADEITNCVGYWKLNNDYVDTVNANNLTASGSPVFSTTVPFSTYTGTSTGGFFSIL